MTRKHFERLAQLMRVHKPADNSSTEYDLWEAMLEDLIIELAGINPRFDVDRFRDAVHK
jgi:hypothetical protein